MQVMRRARNGLRGLLQAYGTPNMKKALWNAEFSRGGWDCLDATPGDCVYPYVEKYAAGGTILDLGCGSGSTANELNISAYTNYVGVDISDVAIAKAIKKTEENGRSLKNRFFQSDFFGYESGEKYNVILFRDSIYYMPVGKILPMLKRYSQHMSDIGVFIVRLWGGGGSQKDQFILDAIEHNFTVVEKILSEKPQAAVIVFR